MEVDERKYVFVCGLHRSGTSVLGRNVARFEDCTGFKNTGATEDEGQFLQDIYPVAAKLGGPGRFGFDARAHRTEKSDLLTPKNMRRLHESWHAHWDSSKRICVEKTPANILMTRFLQKAFPNSYFVVIRRHPVAVSIATQRFWRINRMALHRLLYHWLHCHDLFAEDRPHLKRVYELTYEDYVGSPPRYHSEIAAFIGTHVRQGLEGGHLRDVVHPASQKVSQVWEKGLEEVSSVHNEKYLKQWSKLLETPPWKAYYRYVGQKYEKRFNQYGYSLLESLDNPAKPLKRVDRMLGAVYCSGANAYTLLWRLAAQAKRRLTFSNAAVSKSAGLRNKHAAEARMEG
jgi:hypothetical protein